MSNTCNATIQDHGQFLFGASNSLLVAISRRHGAAASAGTMPIHGTASDLSFALATPVSKSTSGRRRGQLLVSFSWLVTGSVYWEWLLGVFTGSGYWEWLLPTWGSSTLRALSSRPSASVYTPPADARMRWMGKNRTGNRVVPET